MIQKRSGRVGYWQARVESGKQGGEGNACLMDKERYKRRKRPGKEHISDFMITENGREREEAGFNVNGLAFI